ncbi:MAG: glycosyltransferase family 4 protein [Geminicoccaceae bacterium]
MKIAIIDPWCFTPPYNRELCAGLVSIGHEVTLIGQDRSGDSDGYDGAPPPDFSTLGLFTPPADWMPRPLALIAKGVRHVQGLLRSFLELRRLRPDVIHVQWLPLPLIDALFVPMLRRIAPVVLTVHDSNPYNGAGPLLLRIGNLLATRRFDRWIVHNELSERQLVERGLPAERLHRVAHGLLGHPIVADDKSERSDGRVHLLQFGKLKDYKGVDVLLNALSSLSSAQRERCHVSIVGRPYVDTEPLLDLVQRHRLQSFVELKLDFVSDAEMSSLFDDADVLVFPYRGIDTSGVLMAAIARAIPVVASDIGCFSEMLENGEEGLLVRPDDPLALAAALIDLIENPSKIKTMRVNMIALQQRIPSWRRIAETTTQVYELAQAPPASKPIGAHP